MKLFRIGELIPIHKLECFDIPTGQYSCLLSACLFRMPGKHYPLGVRIQAISLLNAKVEIAQVEFLSGLPRSVIYFWNRKAKTRGFDPTKDPRILVEYLENNPRSGRPGIAESTKQAVVGAIQKDKNSREKSCEMVAFENNISSATV